MDDRKSNKFLSVKDLTVEYTLEGKTVHAVNKVSLELEAGKTLALVGETGADKTSIAKAILRILPNPPAKITSGEIYLEGNDLLKLKEYEMRKVRGNKISMIFQDPMTALNPVRRVGDQIAEGFRQHNKVSRAEAFDRAVEMLKMVGISEDRAMEYPHQFSGGMKQRVVIAMALACNPQLLLADEPTTALDVTIQAQVMEMIKDLKCRLNTAMILITHDLGIVAGVADTVAVVYAGEVVEYGTKEQIFDHPTHPYTVGLFDALPDLTKDTSRLHPVEGLPPDPTDLPEGCYFSPRCTHVCEDCHKQHYELRDIGEGHLCRCPYMEKLEK